MKRKMGRQTKLIQKIVLVVGWSSAALSAQVDSASRSKTSSISGIVTNSVTGEPVAHAHVSMRASSSQKTYGAISLSDGRFSFNDIPSETYIAYVERYGYSPPDESKTVEVKPGEKINDVAFQLVPDAVISGRVLDANGVPMEKISVAAVSIQGTQYATTDDRGEFRIGGLRQGRYLIKALMYLGPLPPEIRTDGTVEINYGPTYYPGVAGARSATAVAVRSGQESSGIEIKLLPSPILHISGAILNASESLRQSINVRVTGGPASNVVRLGPDMRFTIWRVHPGHYQLFAEYAGMRDKTMRSAPVEVNVTNTSIEGVNLALTAPSKLTGRVEMEDGSLSSLKRHHALELRPAGQLERIGQDEDIADDGSFKMEEVFPGRYYVIGENLPGNLYVKSARVGAAELVDGILDLRDLSGKGVLTVQLGTNGGQVSGIVRDGKGPVAGVPVFIFFDNAFGTDSYKSVITRPDGSYRFEGVPPGKYKLVAWDRQSRSGSQDDTWLSDVLALYASVTENIDVTEGDKITQDLKLLSLP